MDNKHVKKAFVSLLVMLGLPLLVVGCGDSDEEKAARAEQAAQFTTATKPAPNPQRESLGALVRRNQNQPTDLFGAPRFELYSEYKGEDIKQVTGVSGRSLLLSFTAPWCAHSTRMRQELQSLAQGEKGTVQVIEVNADEYPALAEQFGITKVPTTILYTEGVKLRTIEGAYSSASLRNYIRSVLSQGAETPQ